MNSGVRRFAWLLLILVASGLTWAEEKPKADEQLQQLLKQFPEADANKDGVLTREEAQEHRQKLTAERAKKPGGKTPERAAVEAIKPTEADVKYGPAERNVLDFYQAKSERPTPLVIYIHGGGFVGGNKTVAPAVLKLYLDADCSRPFCENR